jgi:hypothetical protein
LNSATVPDARHPDAAPSWRDPRHFDNLDWELPIPEFDGRWALHRELASAAAEAERVADMVPLRENAYFMRRRRAIRDALAENGVAAVITLSSPGCSTANSKKRGDDLNSQMITRTGSAAHPKKAAMVRYVLRRCPANWV